MDTLSRLVTIQSKNLLTNYSASSLTLVSRYTIDLSLYMDTLSRLITIQSKNLSLYMDTLSRLITIQSKNLLPNYACLSKKKQIPILTTHTHTHTDDMKGIKIYRM